MYIKHVIDKYCHTPKTIFNENADYWFRIENYNSQINSRFAKYQEPFERELP